MFADKHISIQVLIDQGVFIWVVKEPDNTNPSLFLCPEINVNESVAHSNGVHSWTLHAFLKHFPFCYASSFTNKHQFLTSVQTQTLTIWSIFTLQIEFTQSSCYPKCGITATLHRVWGECVRRVCEESVSGVRCFRQIVIKYYLQKHCNNKAGKSLHVRVILCKERLEHLL